MKLEHEFTVPVPAAEAWSVLLDIERIAPCLPGATVTKVDGRDFDGKVKVKVGPITVTYNGSASFSEVDEAQRYAVITARGKEARGTGTANATITARLHEEGDHSRVSVVTDLAITGRPAQFGRGVMNDVGAKLLNRFAAALAEQLAADSAAPAEPAAPAESGVDDGAAASDAASAAEPAASTRTARPTQPAAPQAPRQATPRRPAAEPEPIDLLETAGAPVAKRLAPAAIVAVLLLLLRRRRRRRRQRRAVGRS